MSLRLRQGPYRDHHPTVLVVINDAEHGPFCGDSWCTGACGLPAAEIAIDGEPHRAMGSMVAVGRAWQPYRRAWVGERVRFADELAGEARKAMWR